MLFVPLKQLQIYISSLCKDCDSRDLRHVEIKVPEGNALSKDLTSIEEISDQRELDYEGSLTIKA